MKYEIKLFIGADNKTQRITDFYKSKITDILNFYFDGYNIISSEGFYKGSKEESLLITIFYKSKNLNILKNFLNPIIDKLKNE
jgi:hypothetical protein